MPPGPTPAPFNLPADVTGAILNLADELIGKHLQTIFTEVTAEMKTWPGRLRQAWQSHLATVQGISAGLASKWSAVMSSLGIGPPQLKAAWTTVRSAFSTLTAALKVSGSQLTQTMQQSISGRAILSAFGMLSNGAQRAAVVIAGLADAGGRAAGTLANLVRSGATRGAGLIGGAARTVGGVAGGVVGRVAGSAAAVAGGATAIAGGITSAMTTAMNAVAGNLLLALSPAIAALTSFGTILNATSSGFHIFIEATNVLANVLGSLLLPFFVVLSGAVIALAGYLMNNMDKGLTKFYELVTVTLVKCITALVERIETLSKWFGNLQEHVQAATTVLSMFSRLGTGLVNAGRKRVGLEPLKDPLAPKPVEEKVGKDFARGGEALLGAIMPGVAGALKMGRDAMMPENTEDKTMRALLGGMKDTIQQFRMSGHAGSQASFTGLAQAGREAQLAALNTKPFEAKTLENHAKILDRMERIITKLEQQAQLRR